MLAASPYRSQKANKYTATSGVTYAVSYVASDGEHATWVLYHATHVKDVPSEATVGETTSTLRRR